MQDSSGEDPDRNIRKKGVYQKMTQETNQQEYKTKYDRKMAERAMEKKKEERQLKIMKIVGVILCVAVVVAIVTPIITNVVKKQQVLNGTYVKIGDHELSELEYDYYYYTTVNNYLNTYGSFISYLGLDTSIDFDKQQYDESRTWKDYFDQMTIEEQIKPILTLLDEADKNGFTYDATEDYDNYVASIQEAADNSGISLSDYYKNYFGPYATASNMEGFIKNGYIASAYYEQLVTDNAPTAEEVKAYYEENRNAYDQVDYKSMTFETPEFDEEATDDEKAEDLKDRQQQAEDALASIEAGDEVDGFDLTEGSKLAAVPSCASEWLFDDARSEGDIQVFTDESTSNVYVIQFVKKYYDEANDETISSTLASRTVSDQLQTLADQYEVTDVKGDLKYLTIPETTQEDTAADSASEDTATEDASADNAAESEDVSTDTAEDAE